MKLVPNWVVCKDKCPWGDRRCCLHGRPHTIDPTNEVNKGIVYRCVSHGCTTKWSKEDGAFIPDPKHPWGCEPVAKTERSKGKRIDLRRWISVLF